MKQLNSPLRTIFFLSIGISLLLHLLFFLTFYFGEGILFPIRKDVVRPPLHFDRILLNVAYNFVLAFVLYIVNFKLLENEKLKSAHKVSLVIFLTVIITACMSFSFSYLQGYFDNMIHAVQHLIRNSLVRDYVIALVVVFSSQLIFITKKQQNMAIENETLVAENMRTRYEVLKNQMNPHFLFNSLNTLSSLIKTKPEKAENYLHELSSVLRYTLQAKDVTTLEEELKFTRSYCNLMQIRYGKNLLFDIHINEKYKSYNIIPLSVQVLVENAIKHNIISSKQPLSIIITTTENDKLRVLNPIQIKRQLEPGGRIGLANLSERYHLKWQKEIEISNTENFFEVKIPLIKP